MNEKYFWVVFYPPLGWLRLAISSLVSVLVHYFLDALCITVFQCSHMIQVASHSLKTSIMIFLLPETFDPVWMKYVFQRILQSLCIIPLCMWCHISFIWASFTSLGVTYILGSVKSLFIPLLEADNTYLTTNPNCFGLSLYLCYCFILPK